METQQERTMHTTQNSVDILIVGAGMAGLTAASDLREAGRHVLVIDKGRGVGGRLATRRIEQAAFDHGAQFMTARDPRFIAAIEAWRDKGVVEEWFRNPAHSAEGHPRWRGAPAMTAVAKHLSRDVPLRLGTRVVAVRRATTGWLVVLEDAETVLANAVVLTPPVPQSLALLDAGAVGLQPAIRARLENLEYERCLAVMAVLAAPTRIPYPGGLSPAEGPIAWIADNQMKGVSAVPAVTLHATAAYSLEYWERDRHASGLALLQAAAHWLEIDDVTEFQVHGWRYSKPIHIDAGPCMVVSESPPLIVAGDAFAGARVEGAALSGWAAADALSEM